jgi:ribosome assembly protein 1
MSAWMPLEKAVLSAIIRKLPSPLQSQKIRIPMIAPSLSFRNPELFQNVIDLDPNSLISGFVSKMIPVDPKTQIMKLPGDFQSHSDTLVAFTRVFSGTLSINKPVFVIENKGDAFECVVESLYMLMGQYLIPITEAYPGNIVGIGGLQSIILKTATISSLPTCCSFSPICSKSSPIVKVSVQPQRLYDMPSLINGLKLLDRSDSSVDCYMQDNGEHIMVACGEVHLQRCIKDLEDTFAKVPITTSEPLVSFRETLAGLGKSVSEKTANKRCEIIATAYPLPADLVIFLENNTENMKKVFTGRRFQRVEGRKEFISAFREKLLECEPFLRDVISAHFLGFGPKRCGSNVLVYLGQPGVLDCENLMEVSEADCPSENSSTNTSKLSNYDIDIKETLLTGFDLAANAGPMCSEPMQGVCLVIQDLKCNDNEEVKDIYGPFQGQVISTLQEVTKAAVMSNSPRLSEGMYECTFTTTQDYIGKLYGVISKRRGKIVEEFLTDGTDLFICKAFLPVIESFGFAEELRRITSGRVIPQLVFSHWQTIPEDPFYVRTSVEEIEQFGDQPLLENLPKVLINKIRKRKGLQTDEKLVVHSDKQRTITKMR